MEAMVSVNVKERVVVLLTSGGIIVGENRDRLISLMTIEDHGWVIYTWLGYCRLDYSYHDTGYFNSR